MGREVSHFDHLLSLLELERTEERTRIETLRQTLELGEREARGLAVLDVEVTDERVGLGGRFLLTVEKPQRALFRARLETGSLVEVRPRRADVEGAPRAVIARSTQWSLDLAFDAAPPAFVREGRLLVEVCANDVTYQRTRSVVQRVKAMDRGKPRRLRELLLGNEPPVEGRPLAFEATRLLNPEQRRAVERALSAEDFFLVHGPPGTGKSTVLLELAIQLASRGQRLLATAASNAAVDHLLDLCLQAGLRAVRVGHPARILPRLRDAALDVLVESHPDRVVSRELFDEAFELFGYARRQRAQGRSRERFANARSSVTEAKAMLDEARALERRAVRSVLDGAQVVCATLAMVEGSLLGNEEFDCVLFDEATQATEPLALAAFLKAPKVVLAGDHRQLPPTVLSQAAAQRGLAVSLFERLLSDHGDGVREMLREQYRMHRTIMEFPSRELYGGGLRAHASVEVRTLAQLLPTATLDAPPVLFLDTAGKGFDEALEQGSESRYNEGEAEYVLGRARELLAAGLEPEQLALITPYSAQARLLRDRLSEAEVEVDTVDAFQGREKEVVLVSLTRSNPEGELGFLEDLRRMNVAMTRAKRHLFVVGDSATVGGNPFYARFIEYVQAQGGYRSAWEWGASLP